MEVKTISLLEENMAADLCNHFLGKIFFCYDTKNTKGKKKPDLVKVLKKNMLFGCGGTFL